MIYAGIGSRETPALICRGMSILARLRAHRGDVLRSGAAPGADNAFEEGCIQGNGRKEIFLPWNGFEKRRWNPSQGYFDGNPDLEAELWELVRQFHPRWKTLSQGERKLMMRNCHQVLGWGLDSPADQVVFWASEFKRDGAGLIRDCSGGTGFAVRLAYSRGIDIFSMGIPSHVRHLMQDFADK